MEKDWKKIYSTNNFFQIELIRQVLEEHGIPAVILNKQDSSYRFGQIELYTHLSNEAQALTLIDEISDLENED